MPTGRRAETLVFHSLLRWTPDPMAGETINVGLLAFAEDGSWARFRARRFKTRASRIASPAQVAMAEDWIKSFEAGAHAVGVKGLLAPAITPTDVSRWVAQGSGTLAFTEPTAFVAPSLEDGWATLVPRYLGHSRSDLPAVTSKVTAVQERRSVLRDFATECRRVPSLKEALHRSQKVQGNRLPHQLDLTLENGHLAAVAQALPFAHGSPGELGERRALLFEAALDLPEEVIKLGIFDAIPASRQTLLDSTREFIDAQLGGRVRLVGRSEFPAAIEGLAGAVSGTAGVLPLGL